MIKTGKYRHYKGKEYEVFGTVRHSETLEELVLYKALYQPAAPSASLGRPMEGQNMWVRPLKMFLEEVEVDGKKIRRFEFIHD